MVLTWVLKVRQNFKKKWRGENVIKAKTSLAFQKELIYIFWELQRLITLHLSEQILQNYIIVVVLVVVVVNYS